MLNGVNFLRKKSKNRNPITAYKDFVECIYLVFVFINSFVAQCPKHFFIEKSNVQSCFIYLLFCIFSVLLVSSYRNLHVHSPREKCPYMRLFWSAFSRIRTEYGQTRTRITPNPDTFYAVNIYFY